MFDLGNGIKLSSIKSDRFLSVMEYYKQIGFIERYPNFFVNSFPIYFDPSKRNIGINLSSGADSTLLTFLLCEAINYTGFDIKIYPITLARHWEHNKWNEDAKKAVYDNLKHRYPNIIQNQIWSMLPTPYEFTPLKNLVFPDPNNIPKELMDLGVRVELYHFMEFNNWIARHYNLDVIYNGSNVVPKTELATTPEHRRNEELTPGDQLKVVAPIERFGAKYIAANPFALIEKDWIIAHYDYFGINDLLDITVSCEDKLEGCNNCFHCDERNWAIENKNRILAAL